MSRSRTKLLETQEMPGTPTNKTLQPTHTDADYKATLQTPLSTMTHNEVPTNTETMTELFKSHKLVTHRHSQEKGEQAAAFSECFQIWKDKLARTTSSNTGGLWRTPNFFQTQAPDHASVTFYFVSCIQT